MKNHTVIEINENTATIITWMKVTNVLSEEG